MLYEAAIRSDGARRRLEDVLADPGNARFVVDWGRPGDIGVIAEEGGEPVGAAWLRTHAGDEFAPGYAGEPVAQLAIAVVPTHRGRRWGRRLLEGLLEEADKNGLSEVQLTVGLANVPAVRLYESTGFSTILSDGLSARMRRVLRERRDRRDCHDADPATFGGGNASERRD
ncbi:MAG: GNAT family N-acetyltransferase [Actinobacteria bacterium]|nr:GNAT family N-acetyltransferase [Actinomycetota bacterium]